MKKWMIACGIVTTLVTVAVSPATATTMETTTNEVAAVNVTKTFEGKYDVGGYSLYLNSLGKDKPTVVFDSGYGDDSSVWTGIQAETSSFAQSIRYDRAGLGQSDATTQPRTAKQKAIELHTLLHEAKVKAPYILVGHSLGGVDVRLFASLYPDEVAGLVLVDPTHEDSLDLTLSMMPPEAIDMLRQMHSSPDANFDEVYASMSEVRDTRDDLRGIPLTVVTTRNHGAGPDMEQIVLGFQQDIASLSDRGQLIFSETAGHYIHVDDPQVVIDAIQNMVETVEKKDKVAK